MPKCSQPNCPISETGICLEGTPADCSFLLPDDADESETTAAELIDSPIVDTRAFYSGEKLVVSEIHSAFGKIPTKAVFFVGDKRSGKTTFFARLGEMFRTAKFRALTFAGSKTLCAFERATWLATYASGAVVADTKRTRRGENDTFFHLRVCSNITHREEVLLLSDLAGETFADALASEAFCKNLHSLRLANHLVVFLNGAKLCEPRTRHGEVSNAREFLTRAAKIQDRSSPLCVQVVFSKWDCVERHGNHQELISIIREIEEAMIRSYSAFRSLTFYRIVARRDQGGQATFETIEELISFWLKTPIVSARPTLLRPLNPSRDFCAYETVEHE